MYHTKFHEIEIGLLKVYVQVYHKGFDTHAKCIKTQL